MKKGYFGWSQERPVNNRIFHQRGKRRTAEIVHDNAVTELLKEMTDEERDAHLEETIHAIEGWQPASEMKFASITENNEAQEFTYIPTSKRFRKGAA